jgi:small-conductance mechanosensitive channel
LAENVPEARENASESVLDDLVPVDQFGPLLERIFNWVDAELLTIDAGIQFGLIVAALVPAALFGPRLRVVIQEGLGNRFQHPALRRFVHALATLSVPIALYLALTVVRIALGSAGRPVEWVAGALALMNAWILVRMVTLVIQSQFWSRLAFFVVWPIAALDAFGVLGPVVEQMRELAIPLGRSDDGEPMDISLFDIVRTLFYFGLLFWAANLLSRLIQARIQQIEELSPSLKALLGKVLNVVMPMIALLIAFQIVGFNLATLAVFSGAVGLGVGLGLQRIVANFVAGFTLIADKSIKPGDVIEIDGTMGWVTGMQSRYVALRTRDGTELLIPNDRFMSEGVVNWSRSDRVVRLHAPFGVAYGTEDLELVQKLAAEAAQEVPRVVSAPAPVCNLVGFGDSSVEFDLRFWIRDPQAGLANVRSQVFMGIWRRLREHDIRIPFPQRDVHIRSRSDESTRIQNTPPEADK